MEELKIGQYIRTKKGRIAKITTINEIKYTYHTAKARNRIKFVGQKRTLINGRYEFEDIKKHSPNIIDLIEEGDYVNGVYVRATYLEGKKHYIKLEGLEHIRVYENDIKNIVTHESFNSIKYVIGE